MNYRTSGGLSRRLRTDIDDCGYFPEFVADSLRLALGGEDVIDHLVHQEATFVADEIHRHLTVLALTRTRLIALHTDDGVEEADADDQAITTTESVPLANVRSVALSRIVRRPERYEAGAPQIVETWLALGWGAMGRIDIEPASCDDPTCEADHGYTGTAAGEDLILRMSAAADGGDALARMHRFATQLQHRTGRR